MKQVFRKIFFFMQYPIQVLFSPRSKEQQKTANQTIEKQESDPKSLSFNEKQVQEEIEPNKEQAYSEKTDEQRSFEANQNAYKKEKGPVSTKMPSFETQEQKTNAPQEAQQPMKTAQELPPQSTKSSHSHSFMAPLSLSEPPRKTTLQESEISLVQEKGMQQQLQEGWAEILMAKKKELHQLFHSYDEVQRAYQDSNDEQALSSMQETLKEIESSLEKIEKALHQLQEGRLVSFSLQEQILFYSLEEMKGEKKELLSMLQQNQDYQFLLDKIVELDEKKSDLETEIAEKNATLLEREQKFQDMRTQTDAFLLFQQRLYQDCIQLDFLAKDLEEKANQAIQVEEKIQYKIAFTNRTMAMLLATFALAQKLKGTQAVAANLLVSLFAFRLGRELIHEKQDISYVKSYTDYSKEITSALDSLEEMKTLLQHSLKNLHVLQKEFEQQFAHLLYENKEYQKVYDSICLVKEELEKKEAFLKEEEKPLQQSRKSTEEKVYALKQ